MTVSMNSSLIWNGNNYDKLIMFFNWDTTTLNKNSYHMYCNQIDDIIATFNINVGDKVYYYMQYCTSLNNNKHHTIYISGPITGVDNYLDNFNAAEEALKELGYTVINPARFNSVLPDLKYEQYMSIDFALLDLCDYIYMLDGWQDSKGANREYGYALGKGLKFINNK